MLIWKITMLLSTCCLLLRFLFRHVRRNISAGVNIGPSGVLRLRGSTGKLFLLLMPKIKMKVNPVFPKAKMKELRPSPGCVNFVV
jgi:hypothetical protein